MVPENLNDIKIAFNSNLFVHTTTQIVGHYYKDFVEINEEFELVKGVLFVAAPYSYIGSPNRLS